MMNPQQSSNPDENQKITSFEVQMQIFNKLLSLEEKMNGVNSSITTLSQTLAVNMKQNIDMMKSINEYIGDQMSYRLYRQNLEENNINLQLSQKELELKFLQKKYDTLTEEKQEDDAEAQDLRIEREKLKLEVDNLKRNLDALQEAKHSTKDKMPTIRIDTQNGSKIWNDIMMTAVRTVTAIVIAGILAFIVWMIRFYIQNTP